MDEDQEAMEKLGSVIKALRKKKGLSQIELASMSKLDNRNIQKIEVGKGNPTMNTLVTIAKALEIPFVSLFK